MRVRRPLCLLVCTCFLLQLAHLAPAAEPASSASSSAALQPPDRSLIAVLELEPIGTSKAVASAITDRLREALLDTGRFTLVNTASLQENLVFDGFGGDRIGALLLSPFVKPGSSSDIPYNHYSLLRSLEDIFRIREHLGYAADDPPSNYFLDSIGNDRNVFEHAP